MDGKPTICVVGISVNSSIYKLLSERCNIVPNANIVVVCDSNENLSIEDVLPHKVDVTHILRSVKRIQPTDIFIESNRQPKPFPIHEVKRLTYGKHRIK